MHLAVTYTRFAGLEPPTDPELEREGFPQLLRERIQRFRRPADRMARVAAYRLLRVALAGHTLGPSPLNGLCWDSLGRPFLASLRGADFNLTHSGGLAVCGVAWGGRVGIDVERVRGIGLAGFERYFPASEWMRIDSAADPARAFFESWTRLESVAKAEGFGLTGPVSEMEFTHSAARMNGREWTLYRIDAGPGYCSHAAAWPPPDVVTVYEAQSLSPHRSERGSFGAQTAAEKQEGNWVHG